eukprot:symbB.v1.2.023855.t1/scaffold2217.1/size85520/2
MIQVLPRLQLVLLAQTLDSDVGEARKKLQSLVGTASIVKNCTLMKDIVKLIQETLKWNEAPGAQTSTWRTSPVFPVGKQLERLNALKPTGNLLPKRFPRYNYIHLLAEVMLFKLNVPLPEDPFADAVPGLRTASQVSPDLVYEEFASTQALQSLIARYYRVPNLELQKVSDGLRMTSNELYNNAASYQDDAEQEAEAPEAQVFHICSDAAEVGGLVFSEQSTETGLASVRGMRVSRSYPPVAAPPRGCKSHPGDVKDMPEAGLIRKKAKQEALSWLCLRA